VNRQTELETILRNASWGVAYPTIEAMAAAAVAKGWAPQEPADVQSVLELDTYPHGTIVKSDGITYERTNKSFWGWTAIGRTGRHTSEVVFDSGPVTLLFAPVVE
jgi:hypothetical protein